MSISSWIIWVNSKCHHKYPYKKEAEGDKHHTSRGEAIWRPAERDVARCQGMLTATRS